MKHNVNLGLLGLLLLIITSMIALAIYNYLAFENLRLDYDLAMMNLEKERIKTNDTFIQLRGNLSKVQDMESQLNEIFSELNISRSREDSITTHYSSIKNEAGQLSNDLNATRDERNRYIKLYDNAVTESKSWQNKYDFAKSDLDKKISQIGQMTSKAKQIKDAQLQMESEMVRLEEKLNGIKGDARDIRSNSNRTRDVENNADDIQEKAESAQIEISAMKGYLNQIESLAGQIQ